MPDVVDERVSRWFRADYAHELPHPIASVYCVVFDGAAAPDRRRFAVHFCVYQLLRVLTLPAVSQLLDADLAGTSGELARDLESIRSAIAEVRSPLFSSWIRLARSLRKHRTKLLDRVGLRPFLPELEAGLDRIDTEAAARPVHYDESKRFHVAPVGSVRPLDAMRLFRNATAHGGLLTDPMQDVELHLPLLDDVLAAFAGLGRYALITREGLEVLSLRGGLSPRPWSGPVPDAALDASPVVLVAPDGSVQPLYPLFHGREEGDVVLGYDGHLSGSGGSLVAISYLGTGRHVHLELPAVELERMLRRRQFEARLGRRHVTVRALADAYSVETAWLT